MRHLDALEDARAQQKNGVEGPTVTEVVSQSLKRLIGTLTDEIAIVNVAIEFLFKVETALRDDRTLLTSIPGIGDKTAAKIIGEMPNIADFSSSKAAVAFAGLSPAHRQSGVTSTNTHISKAGNGRLRHALYFPAIVCYR
jgi:transposase